MQNKFLYLLFSIIMLSCRSKKNILPVINVEEERKNFIPVTDIIRGQLNDIDSLPITPLEIITQNGKSDSIWMKKEDIKKWAAPFLHPEIDSINLQQLYIQKSFLDQTINAFTFAYDPSGTLPDTMQLRRWDVYVDPQKQTIKRIYLVKEEKKDSRLQTLQLTWKTGSWAKIVIIPDKTSDLSKVKEDKMIWNFNEEQF